MFRSLTAIAVAPLLFVKPLQAWAESNFPALLNFYSSSIGFLVQSFIIISIFVSYMMLRIIKEDAEEIKFDRVTSIKWQDKLYKNEFFKAIVDAFKPKIHTSKLRKAEKLIKNTNAYLTIEWLYINKVVSAIGAALFTVVLMLNIQLIDIATVYNKIGNEFLSFGKLSPEQAVAAKSLNDYDKKYVDEYKNKNVTKEQLQYEIVDKTTGIADDVAISRIMAKINTINNSYFKFWQLFIVIFVGFVGFLSPTIILMIKNKIREMEKENEIMQFQAIILMLMYIERIDVQTILEWLSRFSYAFKEPISTALNNYEAGAYEALEELKESVPYKDFERIVEQLQSAVERIPIKAAFDELETERSYYYEKRKSGNEKLIQKKVTYGKVLGFMPMIILIGGYLVGPLMIVSIMQMMTYFSSMTY